ncbi:MAG: DUF2147 domain-containing protein [Rhizobiaceae bacterium]
MRKIKAIRWSGKIYSGHVIVLGANSVKLEGCVFGGLICRGKTWSRR